MIQKFAYRYGSFIRPFMKELLSILTIYTQNSFFVLKQEFHVILFQKKKEYGGDICCCVKKTHRFFYTAVNCIYGVMVSMLVSSAVDRGFEPQSGQSNDYKTSICCFATNHPTSRRKSKNWLARTQDNVSEWSNISVCRLLFQ